MRSCIDLCLLQSIWQDVLYRFSDKDFRSHSRWEEVGVSSIDSAAGKLCCCSRSGSIVPDMYSGRWVGKIGKRQLFLLVRAAKNPFFIVQFSRL